ncbi:FecR family protein [Longitalea luteola]|uniref:FecR family protein n=1 Tax=Longitalea luteola TaxID=2812563 RepID=UPI001A95AEF7|nr:FecR domain-containing protein [Longitalea luteola]
MNEQQIDKVTQIASLIVGNMQERLTPAEQQQLDTWLQEDDENPLLFQQLMDAELLTHDLNEMNSYDHNQAFEKLTHQILLNEVSGKRVYFRIWWYMVAALLVLVAGGIAYFSLNKHKNKTATPVSAVVAQKKAAGDLPDTKKAVLILADGSTITLSEISNGSIARQGNVMIQKNQNGQLEYKLSAATANTTGYNTLRTPRGGEYQLILDDGTKIWLNSASTLQFPVHFNSDERRVVLTGEGYFEVQSSVIPNSGGRKRSFIVSVDNMEVQAIGTSFNISAYKEDNRSQTTVVEGLVQVNRNNKTNLLSPGKKLIAQDTAVTVEDVDVKQEIAWTHGEFVFRNTSLKMVMNELTRWYDMDVTYDPGVPSLHFSGEVQRASDIRSVLHMLEYTGGVTFTINKRLITVHPGKK